jgi:hypothetical protein
MSENPDMGHPALKYGGAMDPPSVKLKAGMAAIGEGVSWFSYWDSHDVDRKFELNSLEYTLGLLTNDGRVKEQGRVFKELAEAYRGRAVVFPKTALPEAPRDATIDTTWAWLLDWMGWKAKSE